MNGEPGGFARGLSRLRAGFDAFVGRPAAVQLAGVASVVLVIGALLPWIDYGGEFDGGLFVLGVEGTVGTLTVVVGVAAILVLARHLAGGAQSGPAHLAALGLLACLLVGAELIHIWDNNAEEPAWGIFISAGAAAVLLLAGIALYGGPGRGDRPPD